MYTHVLSVCWKLCLRFYISTRVFLFWGCLVSMLANQRWFYFVLWSCVSFDTYGLYIPRADLSAGDLAWTEALLTISPLNPNP